MPNSGHPNRQELSPETKVGYRLVSFMGGLGVGSVVEALNVSELLSFGVAILTMVGIYNVLRSRHNKSDQQ